MDYIDKTKRAGWDDLYEDCFEGINQIIKDNLEFKHNEELIEGIFSKMLNALEKSVERMKKLEGEKSEKALWFIKSNSLKEFTKQADSPNKKVIAINLIDQFLRATY